MLISQGKNPTSVLVTNHILTSSHSHVKTEPIFYIGQLLTID